MKKYLYFGALLTLFSINAYADSDAPSVIKNNSSKAANVPGIADLSKGFLSDALSFAGEAIPFDNDHVYDKFINNYNKRNNESFLANLEMLAARWFPVIEPILAQYGIPEDFKYIPAIESGFSVNARSHSGATGIWQFMPTTARGYGLMISKKIDERKDIVKSTVAAARYLNDLYAELGSWTLVAAAYNVGQGALKSAMNRQDEDDYFNLKLNKETGNYVYKVIVFKHLLENSDKSSEMTPMQSINLFAALGIMGTMKNPLSRPVVQFDANSIIPLKLKTKKRPTGISRIMNWF
ncbi:lytic transglycosylase domain-containing protein [Solitalea koreensis]|uniref:Transglycosylase SLT domain-containing protein n=1 Tax=Solitalea koreensis TaxID=543615 RepID=A0A521CU21_9SPHI|nr:lytic transglycosylase domain-containing protein [Solitalea koreensis]SMO62231.1 Transglycosylase SLT domain-containing protein [Solitalea koreensis]